MANTQGLSLLLPDKPDVERDAVAEAWEQGGGTVARVARFWDPPELARESVRVYGNETFCLVLQEKLDLVLTTPPDDLILSASRDLLSRTVIRESLLASATLAFPRFVKSMIPKIIASRVYGAAAELTEFAAGLPADTELLCSDPVRFVAEARAFVLRGQVLDVALYEGDGALANASHCVAAVVESMALPDAVVVDVGELADGTWALIEFNAAWGAGLNGCEAERIVPALVAASDPAAPEGPFTRRAG